MRITEITLTEEKVITKLEEDFNSLMESNDREKINEAWPIWAIYAAQKAAQYGPRVFNATKNMIRNWRSNRKLDNITKDIKSGKYPHDLKGSGNPNIPKGDILKKVYDPKKIEKLKPVSNLERDASAAMNTLAKADKVIAKGRTLLKPGLNGKSPH
tara:strand:- start:86 stop:553 length:468 start_codon:yes stop_codon:yes gene_type:complete